MDYEILTRSVIVLPVNEPMYCERATTVEIEDEGGGLYVVVIQEPDTGRQRIAIDPAEWTTLREAIDRMMSIAGARGCG